jgi:putative ABC transport system permease protein
MAFLNFNFTQLFLGEEARAGFDVVVDVNPNNRISDLRETLIEAGYDADASISGTGRLVSAFPEIRIHGPDTEFRGYRLLGADDEFLRLAGMPLQFRAAGYDSDEAVFAALRTDPTTAIVDASRVHSADDPFEVGDDSNVFRVASSDEAFREGPWEPIVISLRQPGARKELTLKIIGVIEPQVSGVLTQFFGIFTNASNVDGFFEGGEQEDYFLTTVDGSKDGADAVAKGVESALLERGVEAESIQAIIDDAAGQSTAFQLLFEGFMSLGLVVGVAALGVIAFRTVVERRQQIGMLRAIGYTRRLIALSFFFESSFIALAGILMGLLLGAALSYNLLTSPEFTDGAQIDFQVPWIRLAIIGGVAYGASALMTLIPARSASRVSIAAALRYE